MIGSRPWPSRDPWIDRWLAVSAATSLLIVAWVWYWAGHGFDLTDEGYYLNWALAPARYPASVSQFGFILKPVFELVDGDIVAFRRLNILAAFGGGVLLAIPLLRRIGAASEGPWRALALAMALASPALLLFNSWLLTPNYNSLHYQALCLAAAGLLWAGQTPSGQARFWGWAWVAVGGVLAFLNKPPSAALLAMLVLAVAPHLAWCGLRGLAWAALGTAGLLVVAAVSIDASLLSFAQRIQLGREHFEALGSGHSMLQLLRFDRFTLTPPEMLGFAALGVAWVACQASFERPGTRWQRAALSALLAIPILLWTLVRRGQVHLPPSDFTAVLYLVFPLATLAWALAGAAMGKPRPPSDLQVAYLFLGLLPYVLAFGTNRNYWMNMSVGGLFWCLAAAALTGTRGRVAVLVALAALSQTLTVLLLATALEHPTRQPRPLREADSAVVLGGRGAPLHLPGSYQAYFNGFAGALARGGFRPGDPVIDLSGHSPGALYAVGARALGFPWIAGDYPGSDAAALLTLRQEPCADIVRAWVLTEPGGPRQLGPAVLEGLGLDLAQFYAEAGRLTAPAGSRGYEAAYEQVLWRPLGAGTGMLKRCEERAR